MADERERTLHLTERPDVPWLSIVLGYGPMLPFAFGALVAWLSAGFWRMQVVDLTIIWAAAILAFLAGVRRGLSFRTEGGPALAQIATMFGLFVLALTALVAGHAGAPVVAAAALVIGFLALQILDPIAARSGQAPLFFARLRPPQLMIAVVSLVALLINVVVR